jgi:predicted PurR-regulated permease PerM
VFLRRIGIPRVLAVVIMYLFFLGIITLMIFVFLPLLFRELAGVIEYFPKNKDPWIKLLDNVSNYGLSGSTFKNVLGTTNIFQGIQNFWKIYLTDSVLNGIHTVFNVVLDLLVVFVMSFFLSIQEGGVNSFLRALTPVRYESYVIDLWNRVEQKIGYWFGGQLLLAVLAGVMAFIGLSIIGMPYKLVISIFLMFLEFIPFGLFIGTLSIVPFAFVTAGPQVGISVLIFFLILNFFESHVFQPLIVHKTVGIPMLLVIISIIAWIELIGWTGAIIAIPFAVLVLEIIYDREKLSILKMQEENNTISE